MLLADPVVIGLQTLAMLMAFPGVLFALACLVLKRAVARGSLFGFIDTLLRLLVFMLPWGTIVTGILILLLAAAGCSAEWHHAASGIVLTMAAGSAVIMYRVARLHDAGQRWFYVPGLISALISGWLFIAAK